MNEYIIVNKTIIEKRIEELETKLVPNPQNDQSIDSYNLLFLAKQNELQQVLSQSTPLVPEILKSIEFGALMNKGMSKINKQIKDYISNLKLDI